MPRNNLFQKNEGSIINEVDGPYPPASIVPWLLLPANHEE